jgi:pimeloyl-ACP methyl ester carboxylesterase
MSILRNPLPAVAGPPVVLVHGLWMTGWEMGLLGRRLRRRGLLPRRFPYADVRRSPADNARRLQEWVRRLEAPQVHFVAHSLGGILLLHLFDRFPDQAPGRLVLLGPPVAGSRAARHLQAKPWLRPLLGRSLEQGLLGGAPGWQGTRELGVIAGTLGLGAGRLLGPLERPHDGTVTLMETQLQGAKEQLQLPVSHTGLILSAEVARQVGLFLHAGAFAPPGSRV